MEETNLIRIEVIANQSVLDEIVNGIEAAVPDVLWTMLPTVLGKGKRDRKMGTAIWPETNFLLICYADSENSEKIHIAIRNVKKRFPTEGIAVFDTLSKAGD